MKLAHILPVLLLASLPAAAQGGAPAPATGTFTLIHGETTVLTESFRRAADRLEVEMELYDGTRAAYDFTLHADGSVGALSLRQWGSGADEAPAVVASGEIAEGRLSFRVETAQGSQTPTFEVAPGSVVYINPSPAAMEQIVLRARAMGGTQVEVPVWVVDGGQAVTASVAFTEGEAVLSLADVEVLLQLDPSGHVLGGTVPQQGLVIVRS
jgi:hypothetical protein